MHPPGVATIAKVQARKNVIGSTFAANPAPVTVVELPTTPSAGLNDRDGMEMRVKGAEALSSTPSNA